MIRNIALAFVPAALLAAPLLAQDVAPSNDVEERAILSGEIDLTPIDSDGDGKINLLELTVAWPDLTEADFLAWDADADGFLNTEELTVAFEAGYITDPVDIQNMQDN